MTLEKKRISALPSLTSLSGDEVFPIVGVNNEGVLVTYQATVSQIIAGGSFASQSQVDTGATGVAVSPNTLLKRLVFPYDNTLAYAVGRYVEYNFVLYKCIQLTTAGILPTNTSYFTPVGATDFASASQLVAGTANKSVPASLASTRMIFLYDASVAYVLNQVINYNDALYRVLTTTVAGDTPVSEPTKFQLIQQPNVYAGNTDLIAGTNTVKVTAPAVLFDKLIFAWDSMPSYKEDSYVDYSNSLYRVVTTTSPGDTPVSAPAKFQAIGFVGSYAVAADIISGVVKVVTADLIYKAVVHAYSGSTTYSVGQFVNSGTKIYKAKGTTTGNAPPSATYWDEIGFVPTYATAANIRAGDTGNKIVDSEQLYAWWQTVSGSNVGAGAGIFKDKNLSGSAENFRFKSLTTIDTRITMTSNTNDIQFNMLNVNGPTTVWTTITSFQNAFTNSGGAYQNLMIKYEAADNTIRIRGTITNPGNQANGTAVFSIPAPFSTYISNDSVHVHVQENATPVIVGLKVAASGLVSLVGPYTSPNNITVNIILHL